MKTDDLFQASDDVVCREVANETVLLDLASGLYFGLNRAGSRAWARLSEGPCSVIDLAKVIECEFDAPYDQIERDVLELVQNLAEKKLVQPVIA